MTTGKQPANKHSQTGSVMCVTNWNYNESYTLTLANFCSKQLKEGCSMQFLFSFPFMLLRLS